MLKSARRIALGKALLLKCSPLHICPSDVVAVGSTEHIRESPSLFITRGQQIVALPIVALSSGTGIKYSI